MYVAKQGDTWDLIAYKVYGDEYFYSLLIEANLQYIDTVVFEGGEKLEVPDIPSDDLESIDYGIND